MTNKKAVAKAQNQNNVLMPVTKADVPAAIEALKAQLAKLKEGKKEVSTDITYIHANGSNVNIKDVTTVKELLEIYSSISARGAAFNQSIIDLNLTGANIAKWTTSEKTVAQWKEIIDMAIFELINKKNIEKLENAIKKLSTHLDEETKLQNELEEIMGSANAPII